MADAHLDTLRCADQDRELVAGVLGSAYADGRLSFEEHADRIARAYDAKTFGELNVLTADLVPASPATSVHSTAQHPSVSAAYRGGHALFSTLRPGFIPVVDSKVTLNTWLGEARIDLVGSQFVSQETIIQVGVVCGEIKIRVPEGVSVNVSEVTTIMAETSVKGIVPGSVLLQFTGTLLMGELNVLGPDVPNQRKYEKFVR